MNFDPWGRRRNASDWTFNSLPTTFMFDRGFTGHEHLNEFKLVNMNGRIYDPVLGRFLSPDNYLQLPDYTQNLNRYTYALNNPLSYTDPSGNSFLGSLFGAWFGNYLIGGADRWINKGMSFNDAFFNKNYITASADVTFSPSNFSFSNYQVTQQLIATQTGILSQQLDEVFSGFSGLGRKANDWFSDHIFIEVEGRFDYGLQLAVQGKLLGAAVGGAIEDNTKPLVQLNFGYNEHWYGRAYSWDMPTYGYGGVNDPIRKRWSATLGGGAEKNYENTNGILKFDKMTSTSIYWGAVNIEGFYGSDGHLLETHYYWQFGEDLAAILGLNYQLKIGYKHIKK